MALCGAFWIWMFILINTSIQLRTPRSMIGRMLGLYQLAVIGPIAIGSLLAGLWAEIVGIRVSLMTCSVLLVAWGIWHARRVFSRLDPSTAGVPAL